MITTLDRQEKALLEARNKVTQLETEIAASKRRFTNEPAAIIDELPKRLRVPNFEGVLALVRSRMKDELGALDPGSAPAASRQSRRLTPEQKTKLDELIKTDAMTGAEICAAVGCSIGTVTSRKAELKKLAATAPLPVITAPAPALS